MNIEFKRATRASVPLKIGITGPSGSGKTTAALRMARGLVGQGAPIAFCDTENGSASLYAHLTEFDVINMNPPYQVAKFTATIDAAVQAGYKALIIDSASAEWQELLAEKEALDARGGNSFTNWGSIGKKHEDFLKAVRNASIHLILCLRSKQEHVQDKDANGKTTVKKVGLAAIQREGMEYELTTVFDIAMDHHAKTSKDRTGMFDGRIWPLSEATGRELAEWLTSGATLAPNTGEAFQASAPAPAPETPAEAFRAQAELKQAEKPPVSQLAEEFVESIQPEDPTPVIGFDPEPEAITEDQYEALGLLIEANGIDRAALRAYCAKAGHLLPSKTPTLARMKPEAFAKLRTRLSGKDAKKVVSIINAHSKETAA